MRLFFWTYGDGKGYKFDERQGWIKEGDGKGEKDKWIYANTEIGEVVGILNEFEGALSWREITEVFTIPQLEIMLKDKPHIDYDKEEEKTIVGKADSASGVMDFLMGKKNGK